MADYQVLSQMECWDVILDDILEIVLQKMGPHDVASMRTVCRSWRAKTDALLTSMKLQQPECIASITTHFQAGGLGPIYQRICFALVQSVGPHVVPHFAQLQITSLVCPVCRL
jgi:hypothetical protein